MSTGDVHRMSAVEKIQRLWDTFESDGFRGAVPLMEQVIDPDVEFNPLEAGGAGGRTYRGHDGMFAFFAELAEGLDEVAFEPVQCHPVGDNAVVAFTRMVGIERDRGLPLRQDLPLLYEFDESGLVRTVTAYETPAEALEAAQRGHADA